jgi:hypothetical protein
MHSFHDPALHCTSTFVGKLIQNHDVLNGPKVTWVVTEPDGAYRPTLQDVTDLFRWFNKQRVRITVEELGDEES